jgi:adenosine 3'-phospho 5'-phosphosulfate transporter B2
MSDNIILIHAPMLTLSSAPPPHLSPQAFSAAFSTLGLLSAGQLGEAVAFVGRHPDALTSMLTLSAAATLGQLFISHTIKTFGALLFATVMTTRQFLSILLSCVIFAHPLSLGQWAGTGLVFGALYYKTLAKKGEAPGSAKAGAAGAGADTELGRAPAAPEAAPLVAGAEPVALKA